MPYNPIAINFPAVLNIMNIESVSAQENLYPTGEATSVMIGGYQRSALSPSRRDFLRFVGGCAVVAATAPLLAACGADGGGGEGVNPQPFVESTSQVDQSRLDKLSRVGLEGGELMEASHFNVLVGALRTSGSSVFKACANGLESFYYGRNIDNSIFSAGYSSDTVPFVITRDFGNISLVSEQTMYMDENGHFSAFGQGGNTMVDNRAMIEPILAGIHIGAPELTRQEDPLIEALYLAKEYLTYIMQLAIAKGLYDGLSERGIVFSTDRQIDQTTKDLISATIAFSETQTHSNIGLAMDLIPAFVVGLAFVKIGQNKGFNGYEHGLATFNNAILTSMDYPNFANDIENLSANYASRSEGFYMDPTLAVDLIIANPETIPAREELYIKIGM